MSEGRRSDDSVATVTLVLDGILGVLNESAAQLNLVLGGTAPDVTFSIVNTVIGRLGGAAWMIEVIANAG